MMECVVDTGSPNLFARNSHIPAPSREHIIPNMSTEGWSSKAEKSVSTSKPHTRKRNEIRTNADEPRSERVSIQQCKKLVALPMILERIESVTAAPSKVAPAVSRNAAIAIATGNEIAFEPTELLNVLATSFAPIAKAVKKHMIAPKITIQRKSWGLPGPPIRASDTEAILKS